MWVVCSLTNNVYKLKSDGAVQGKFAVGTTPYGVSFDGGNIWVVNFANSTVTKLASANGAVLGTFNVGGGPEEIVFDGTSIWVVNVNDSTVSKL
jgi:DNA-binding beta-propeller fold protein YncE